MSGHEHPLGFSCEDVDDRLGDLERAVAELSQRLERERRAADVESEKLAVERNAALRSLARIHTWLGKAMEQKTYRGDMVDAEGLIEDAYGESEEWVQT